MENLTNVQQHNIPKCLSCGTITKWKIEPLFTSSHLAVGVVLLVMGVFPGIIYLGTVTVIRSNPNNRAKICPRCGGRNMWTFMY